MIFINILNQRNVRPVVSVGVSTECGRLEFEGPHALDKNGFNKKITNVSIKHIGRKRSNYRGEGVGLKKLRNIISIYL